MSRYVALIRGINVGGHNKVPMAELRRAVERRGMSRVQTYIQSGNLIFDAAHDDRARLESDLESCLRDEFAVDTAVLARSAAEWDTYPAELPFVAEAAAEPNRVMLGLCKRAPLADAAAAIAAKAQDGEQVAQRGEHIWIYFGQIGAGRSKLTPKAINTAVGTEVTLRNWRTVLKLQQMLR